MESIIRKIKNVDWYRSGRVCICLSILGLVGCGTIKKAGVVATAAGTVIAPAAGPGAFGTLNGPVGNRPESSACHEDNLPISTTTQPNNAMDLINNGYR